MNDVQLPDFFIIGAPKCGTTALARYLREHHRIFLSSEKEPWFFANDLYINDQQIRSWSEYETLFAGAEGHDAVGEGSVFYLFSGVAIDNILHYYPKARFIVMLRHPVELFESLFYQYRKTTRETAKTPERAWQLQWERERGRKIPLTTYDMRLLQYKDVCALGSQLERLHKKVDDRQVLTIFYEDFKQSPQHEYQRVLSFLNVPDDGKYEFPVVNARKQPMRPKIAVAFETVGKWKRSLGLRRGLGFLTPIVHRVARWVHRTSSAQRQYTLSVDFRQKLNDYFAPEINKLEKLTGRDLSHWYN